MRDRADAGATASIRTAQAKSAMVAWRRHFDNNTRMAQSFHSLYPLRGPCQVPGID